MNNEIKRMAAIIGNVRPFYVETIAEALYNAGYRKAFTSDLASDTQKAYKEGYDKARKETAKEIFKSFENAFSLYYPHGILTYEDFQNHFMYLAKKYGVEVQND